MNTDNKKPYAFDKRIDKAIVAAETVLGPEAVRKLIEGLVTGFGSTNDGQYGDVDSALKIIMSYVDPQKQIVIKAGENIPGEVTIEARPKEAAIGTEFAGYTTIDIKSAIYAAIRDDLTGFVLQALQIKWERDLTLDDAENITFHLNKLIHLLT